MFSEKITLLNQTVLECLNKANEKEIVKIFVDVGTKVLGADFGFVWLRSCPSSKLRLIYKSPNLPFKPKSPRKRGRNYKAITTSKIGFVTHLKRVSDAYYVSHFIKSFVIIPISYRDDVYGSIVFCFKETELFPSEKKIISTFIGNSAAQAITISRLVASEREARLLSRKHEIYYKTLIEDTNEIIILVDRKRKIFYVSPSINKISGYKADDIIGHDIKDFICEKNVVAVERYIKKVIDNPEVNYNGEFCYKRKDGQERLMECTSVNMIKNESIKGIVINVRDITERKQIEEMRKASMLLNEEKLKNDFIADAAHELRTPLAIMRGNVDLALRSNPKPDKSSVGAFKAINNEIENLSNILSDLTMLTSGKTKLPNLISFKEVNLKILLEEVVKRCNVMAHKKGISISMEIPNIVIMGDESGLEKLFLNLIKNAITYGRKNGWIKIKILKDNDKAKIIVSDNGIGIPKEYLPKIFDRFYRMDKTYDSDGKHAGLGLAISKLIVDTHNGSIEVESTEKKGSTFTISLPSSKKKTP